MQVDAGDGVAVDLPHAQREDVYVFDVACFEPSDLVVYDYDADSSGEVTLDEFVASWKGKYAAYPPEMQTRMLDAITAAIS